MTSIPPPNDDDLTIVRRPTQTGPSSNALDMAQLGENILPIGTRLEEFEITGLIGYGGFGIVYLVYDHYLQCQVALKEYMPSSLAIRNSHGEISLRSNSGKEIFQTGLRSFINEARLLRHFDHPSLVKCYRFFESNKTAYMVMPFYQGTTLKEKVGNTDKPPDEKWLKDLLLQLLDALNILHKDKPQCLHRDISPDNILILPNGRAVLLDFGAARRVISDMTQALTVILKPGYAPVEQYAEEINLTQGPWTDIYAIAAVIYFVITRKTPTPSISRLFSDTLIPLTEFAKNKYSIDFLKGIDKALAVRPENRPQNIDEFRRLLGITQQHSVSENSNISNKSVSNKGKSFAILSAIAIVSSIVIMMYIRDVPQTPSDIPHIDKAVQAVPPAQLDPVHELEVIFNARNRKHAVTVSMDKTQAHINSDQLNFKIRSAKSGYVYILAVGTNQSDFLLLFPNAKDQNNRIAANQQMELPRKEWPMIAGGPPGTNHFIAIVSDHPRSFGNTGVQTMDMFGTFSSDQTKDLYRAYKGSVPFFAGKASCPSDQIQECSDSYGADLFSIEEIEI